MASPDKSERIKNVIDFVQTSKLVDTKAPIDTLMGNAKTLSAMGGTGSENDYVIAWERYVLVVASAQAGAPGPAEPTDK